MAKTHKKQKQHLPTLIYGPEEFYSIFKCPSKTTAHSTGNRSLGEGNQAIYPKESLDGVVVVPILYCISGDFLTELRERVGEEGYKEFQKDPVRYLIEGLYLSPNEKRSNEHATRLISDCFIVQADRGSWVCGAEKLLEDVKKDFTEKLDNETLHTMSCHQAENTWRETCERIAAGGNRVLFKRTPDNLNVETGLPYPSGNQEDYIIILGALIQKGGTLNRNADAKNRQRRGSDGRPYMTRESVGVYFKPSLDYRFRQEEGKLKLSQVVFGDILDKKEQAEQDD